MWLASAYRTGRLVQMMPTWVLVEAMPLFPPPFEVGRVNRNDPAMELVHRLAARAEGGSAAGPGPRAMSNAEIAAMVRRMAEGNWYAPAGSPRWAETTGRWLGAQWFRFQGPDGPRYQDGSPADAALLEAVALLDAVMPEWQPRTRPAWPAGVPVRINSGLARPVWRPVREDINEDAAWSVRGAGKRGNERGFLSHFELPPLGSPGDEVVLDLRLGLHTVEYWKRSEDEAPVREQDFVLRWRVVERVEDVAEMVDSAEIRAAIASALIANVGGMVVPEEIEPFWLGKTFDGVGFGVKMEVFDDKGFLASGYCWWLARGGVFVERQQGDLRLSEGWEARLMAGIETGALRVRATGEAAEGLRLLDADRVWVGQVEMTLSEAWVIADGADPEPPAE